jgi:hypothetical protein
LGKVFLINVPNEFGVKGLINEGKMLKFHFNGTCLGEFPLSFSKVSLQEVDIVSLLVLENGELEVGYNIAEVFSKKTATRSLSDIVLLINAANGLVFAGKRDEKDSYVQYIYAFMRGVLSPETEL